MNLHILDEDPHQIPKYLDDKRVGKMLMETNQLLSLAVTYYHAPNDLAYGEGRLVGGTAYMNHPVALWVRQTRANFQFALNYAVSLDAEFYYRFGKHHKSGARTMFIRQNYGDRTCVPGDPMSFANCARHKGRGLDFTEYAPVVAYRRYMLVRLQDDARNPFWTGRPDPRFDWEREYGVAA
jgi:hypothetical protein